MDDTFLLTRTPSDNSPFEAGRNNNHKTNKPMKRTFFTFLLVFLTAFAWAQQVHHGESFELDEPVQPIGNDEYRATQYISLERGFLADPVPGTSLLLRLSPLGIQDNTFTVSAYPNPVKGLLNINLSGIPTDKRSRIHIVDAQGRVCMELQIHGSGGSHAIDISNLSPGIYLYRIGEPGACETKGKFVKQ